MGTESEQLARAARNRGCADRTDPAEYPDWFVVAHSYRAVHLVEAALAKGNEHSTHHEARKALMLAHPRRRDVFIAYRTLKSVAELARYGTRGVTGLEGHQPASLKSTIEGLVAAVEVCFGQCR